MVRRDSFLGLRTLVLGLGRFGGGVAVTRWLAEQGAAVTVSDQASGASLARSIDAVADLPVALKLGGNDPADLDGIDLVVVNPAVVKARSAFFREVTRRAIPWTTEINLFCERCPAKIIGVTGSFGKSTTCAMLATAIRACLAKNEQAITSKSVTLAESASPFPIGGWVNPSASPSAVHLGGNIGKSLLPILPQISGSDVVILELSSAQLEDLPRIHWVPHIGVITNLHPHHADRYASPTEYYQAKLNMVRSVESAAEDSVQTMIVGEVDPAAEPLVAEVAARPCCEVVRVRKPDTPVELRAPGDHNQTNAAAALTLCNVLGLDAHVARASLRDFRGLPHRLELVATLAGVDFINDSKSTSPATTVAAIDSFERPIVAIVGGQRKDVSWTLCADKLRASCREVVCFGEAGADVATAAWIESDAQAPNVQNFEDLQEAVSAARAVARDGDVVVFSPGAPSFDRYANFTDRGDHFRKLVMEL